jgi:2-polyprenyl-3-methyl-5-hydroxy-6-metoxy-1,4-benzoquinol methylase
MLSIAPNHCDFCSQVQNSKSVTTLDLEKETADHSTYTASSSKRIKSKVLRCESCSLIQLEQIFMPGTIVHAYNNASETSHNLESENRMKSFARQVSKFREILEVHSGGNLLDIGCAEGSFLRSVRDFDLNSFGVEPSKNLSKIAREVYNLEVIEGDAVSANQFGIKFQIISLWDVLEHVESPSQTFLQINDLIQNNGILILNLPMVDTFPAKTLRRYWPFYLEVHLYYFTLETILQYTEKFGYQLLHQRRFWQTLSIRYLIESRLNVKVNWLPRIPIKYYMGQRTLVFQRTKFTP